MKRTKYFRKIALPVILAICVLAANAQQPRQEQLLNGLKVLMWQDAQSPDVKVRLRIHAGAAFDPQGKEGTMQLLADDLFPNESAKQFFAEDLGGSLDIKTTYDYIQIDAISKPDQFLSMLETLASSVSNPAIDKDTTANLKKALNERLTKLEADPDYLADQAAASRLLGTFPYGRPSSGSVNSIKNISFADLIDARERFLTADNATITLTGNFDRNLAFKAIRRYFGNWQKADRKVPATFRQPDDVPSGVLNVASPAAGAFEVRAAIRGVSRNAKDFFAAEVYARVLEDRLKARVPAEYASQVFVRHEGHVQPGLFLIGLGGGRNDIGTGNGKVGIGELLPKALGDALTDAEFASARTAVASEFRKIAPEEFWLDADTYKLVSAENDRASFERVTIADVRAMADRVSRAPVAMVVVAPTK